MKTRILLLTMSAMAAFTFSCTSIHTPKDTNGSVICRDASSLPQPTGEMLIRIAEIEVFPNYLKEYLAAAATVGAESVAKEPGVLCIFPMQRKDTPNIIRIVEIYRDEVAYKSHLATPHFLKYKEGTLHMVKSLELVPMNPLDAPNMNQIFRKIQ